jgi:hypothetical protein
MNGYVFGIAEGHVSVLGNPGMNRLHSPMIGGRRIRKILTPVIATDIGGHDARQDVRLSEAEDLRRTFLSHLPIQMEARYWHEMGQASRSVISTKQSARRVKKRPAARE